MAVANAWATGRSAVPPPQLRPPSSSFSPETLNHFFKKKFSLNLPNKSLARRNRNSKLSCRCSNNLDDYKNYSDCGSNNVTSCSSSSACSSSSSSADWDWNRWTRHFSEIEQAENYASVLKFQLEDAIENEDFQEAAKLKIAIAEATSKDCIAEIMSQLKIAIDEERYHDASRLCRSTASGLLVTSSPGTPLFEIFVVKDANETYNMQVVFLKQLRSNSANSSSSSDKSTKGPSTSETDNASVVDVKLEGSEVEKGEGKNIDLEGAAEEGIKSVINFLKEKSQN
ncbi:UNVERIFIED_CONTAM: protein EXECUTER 2, chloroplastic [Sesamum angustifolium]|uniref:Protein EXECUTER 2, chloroplastic n=1 Tax=Sesamum angustifolium TaxID=2727405 RepID=A0AAW2KP55_9LAMI